MFHFNSLLIASFLIFSSVTHAQEEEAAVSFKPATAKTFAITYQTWLETLELTTPGQSDSGYANFYGLAVTYEKENYSGRWGQIFDASVLSGQANAGGSQRLITYQQNYRGWFGLQGTYRLAYRLSPQITLSIGPLALARQISWPEDATSGAEAKSGSQANFGLIANLNYRLSRQVEIRQMIGTLASKASVIWSLGVGYKF